MKQTQCHILWNWHPSPSVSPVLKCGFCIYANNLHTSSCPAVPAALAPLPVSIDPPTPQPTPHTHRPWGSFYKFMFCVGLLTNSSRRISRSQSETLNRPHGPSCWVFVIHYVIWVILKIYCNELIMSSYYLKKSISALYLLSKMVTLSKTKAVPKRHFWVGIK